jgi:hypothetical protein
MNDDAKWIKISESIEKESLSNFRELSVLKLQKYVVIKGL